MLEITEEQLHEERYLLYVHTPFCGTCSIARMMLEKIESIHQQDIFYEMNGNYHEKFLHAAKIESVPCLLIVEDDEIKEKVYTFYSIGNIYQYLYKYKPELFTQT